MCLLLCIGTAAAADLYQIVLNMLVSVQYKPRNLQNAYAVSELSQQMCYRYVDNCRSVSDQLCDTTPPGLSLHVTREFEFVKQSYGLLLLVHCLEASCDGQFGGAVFVK